jgi:hypothetical protein
MPSPTSRAGIYHGHVGHEGHISRTVLKLLESDEVIFQDEKTKTWQLRHGGAASAARRIDD